MSPPKPVFNAASLALFLQAHVMRAGALAADLPIERRANDPARRNAERAARARIRREAEVSRDVFDAAFFGRPVMPAHARRLWLAMEIDPHIAEEGR